MRGDDVRFRGDFPISLVTWLTVAFDETTAPPTHPSDAGVQIAAEAVILDALGETLGRPLGQGVVVLMQDVEVRPDGVDAERSVFVEVFAHVGKLRGGQRHKVSTDALKLLAIRAVYSEARLILAFADGEAAESVSGWKAKTLAANGIEIRVVELPPAERAKIEAAQRRQRMVNSA
jgi:hypothetical protein